jgi:hypothetical protein
MSELCSYISKAECCFVSISRQRVNNVTFGFDTDDSLYNVLLMQAMIGALERYKCGESCLSEEELAGIYEQIDFLCSSCNCNCN